MNQQENREIRISPDALIALVVAEAEDRELSAMPSLEEMNAAFHPSEEFQKKNEYQSENGEWLTVRILPIQDKQSTFVDDEYTHYYQISFYGIDAVLGSTIDGSNVLVWQNDGLTYQVSSSCDLSEIISVAEGIKLDSSSNG